MFKIFYTTQMSSNARQLQARFTKMRSKSGRLSKLMAAFILIMIVAILTCATIVIAAVDTNGIDKSVFSDINGHYAEDIINKYADSGIISGYPDGTFKPDNSVTRAELAKILVGAFDLQETNALDYADVDSSAWYYSYLERVAKYIPVYALPVAYDSNIPYIDARAQGENEFLPDVDAIRTHVAEALVEIKTKKENLSIEIPSINDVQSSLLETFNDADYEELFTMVSGTPENVQRMFNYAWLANELNVMQGDADGYFRPYGKITRAELLIAIDRILAE